MHPAQLWFSFPFEATEVFARRGPRGLGIDKPDVRLVVHWTLPATPEAYYEERAGRGKASIASRSALQQRQRYPHEPGIEGEQFEPIPQRPAGVIFARLLPRSRRIQAHGRS